MNCILNKDSYLSKQLGGYHLFSISNWELGGVMIIFWSIWFHIFLYSEQVITIFLNLDVIQTISNPLDRSKRLEQFKKLMKLGFFVICLVCFGSIIFITNIVEPISAKLTRNATDYYAYSGIGAIIANKATFDIQINSFFNFYTLFQQSLWLIITVYGTVLCLIAYFSKFDLFFPCQYMARKCFKMVPKRDHEEEEVPKIALNKVRAIANREVKSMVFRRQVIYFIVLLVTELPSVVFFYYMGYLSKFVPPEKLQQAINEAKPY